MRNHCLVFLAPFDVDRWIKEDPAIEMRGTFTIPLSSKAINSGPTLLCFTACLLRLPKPNHPSEVFSIHSES